MSRVSLGTAVRKFLQDIQGEGVVSFQGPEGGGGGSKGHSFDRGDLQGVSAGLGRKRGETRGSSL